MQTTPIEDMVSTANSSARGLVCFDMDSTLVDGETLDILAERKGVSDEVKKITDQAMNGKMDFDDAVKKRIGLLEGMKVSEVFDIAGNIPFMPGAKDTIRRLKENGFVTGMITGGFSIVAERISRELGLDFFVANELQVEDGALTGGFQLHVNGNKEKLMMEEARRFRAGKVFAVGDGMNDLGMLLAADVGIAFCPKPALEEKAEFCVKEKDLTKVLDFIREHGDGAF